MTNSELENDQGMVYVYYSCVGDRARYTTNDPLQGYKLREIIPSPRGLVCALSTEERRMDCRMYVEAEVGKKVSHAPGSDE